MCSGDPLSTIVSGALGKLEHTLPTAYQRASALKKADVAVVLLLRPAE
jgi:hypothetical protein